MSANTWSWDAWGGSYAPEQANEWVAGRGRGDGHEVAAQADFGVPQGDSPLDVCRPSGRRGSVGQPEKPSWMRRVKFALCAGGLAMAATFLLNEVTTQVQEKADQFGDTLGAYMQPHQKQEDSGSVIVNLPPGYAVQGQPHATHP